MNAKPGKSRVFVCRINPMKMTTNFHFHELIVKLFFIC